MDTEILEKIGLSRAEIKVYLALLELGISTVGAVTKRSGIPSSNIYPILDNLASKGLISHTITANKRHYKAEDPNRLKDFIKEQKQQLENQETKLSFLISDLSKIQCKLEKTQESFTYEGIKGIKTALEFVLKVLKKEDTFYVIDASKIMTEKLIGYFNDFANRRAKQGIKYKIIYGAESIEFAKERKKYKLTEVKVLPEGIIIPSVFWIFKDYVVIAVFSDNPIALMIKNKQMAEGFLANFNLLWCISKQI